MVGVFAFLCVVGLYFGGECSGFCGLGWFGYCLGLVVMVVMVGGVTVCW